MLGKVVYHCCLFSLCVAGLCSSHDTDFVPWKQWTSHIWSAVLFQRECLQVFKGTGVPFHFLWVCPCL
ncbi:hypothetical protein M758_10G072800 [Ceratodon purpureus]|nr:hypothetical protein M758_10G072800 [Ceratodon purpureus]